MYFLISEFLMQQKAMLKEIRRSRYDNAACYLTGVTILQQTVRIFFFYLKNKDFDQTKR